MRRILFTLAQIGCLCLASETIRGTEPAPAPLPAARVSAASPDVPPVETLPHPSLRGRIFPRETQAEASGSGIENTQKAAIFPDHSRPLDTQGKPRAVRFDGLLRDAAGHTRLWVDGRPYRGEHLAGGCRLRADPSFHDGALLLDADDRSQTIRVGQSLYPVSPGHCRIAEHAP